MKLLIAKPYPKSMAETKRQTYTSKIFHKLSHDVDHEMKIFENVNPTSNTKFNVMRIPNM